jgi:hypothetical protein
MVGPPWEWLWWDREEEWDWLSSGAVGRERRGCCVGHAGRTVCTINYTINKLFLLFIPFVTLCLTNNNYSFFINARLKLPKYLI